MRLIRKPTGKATSMPTGLLWGAIISLAVTIFLAAITAWLTVSEVIKEENIGYAVMILLSVSAFAGAMAAFQKIKRQRMFVSILSGMIYFLILLLITVLFFGGKFSAVGETALMVLCGAVIHGLTSLKPSGKSRRRRYV